jgi:hypothetical protein
LGRDGLHEGDSGIVPHLPVQEGNDVLRSILASSERLALVEKGHVLYLAALRFDEFVVD